MFSKVLVLLVAVSRAARLPPVAQYFARRGRVLVQHRAPTSLPAAGGGGAPRLPRRARALAYHAAPAPTHHAASAPS
ncbi:hypothetical protein EVAR_63038_1 [Eumeta japonica]|uniref:Secreted protein n=1 Tax=Eumeta variegata TaxID=151549 RepID=A0A4C1Z2R5_EUMVA|nr:hypothetical protein EVAR_63038_1 [Eumeta japonica]